MRKTEYIAPEFNRYGVASDRQEVKVGYNLKKNKQDENLYRDRQSQLDAIDKTFRDVSQSSYFSIVVSISMGSIFSSGEEI